MRDTRIMRHMLHDDDVYSTDEQILKRDRMREALNHARRDVPTWVADAAPYSPAVREVWEPTFVAERQLKETNRAASALLTEIARVKTENETADRRALLAGEDLPEPKSVEGLERDFNRASRAHDALQAVTNRHHQMVTAALADPAVKESTAQAVWPDLIKAQEEAVKALREAQKVMRRYEHVRSLMGHLAGGVMSQSWTTRAPEGNPSFKTNVAAIGDLLGRFVDGYAEEPKDNFDLLHTSDTRMPLHWVERFGGEDAQPEAGAEDTSKAEAEAEQAKADAKEAARKRRAAKEDANRHPGEVG
ncbi:hypothetical protein [Kitasatospora sp. NPDC101183]|uniref:hypothetical protein n=1 Tax=Kitasatospora sp. NPDC101183 TaxID=3364100 RepID=UPI00380B9E9F